MGRIMSEMWNRSVTVVQRLMWSPGRVGEM